MHRRRDKIRGDECERDHHHDVTPAAVLAGGDIVRASGRAIDDLLQPFAADRNRPYERRSGLGTDGTDILAARHHDLTAAACGWLLPADRQAGAAAEQFPSSSRSSTASVEFSESTKSVMSSAASRSTILSTDPVITARSSRAC